MKRAETSRGRRIELEGLRRKQRRRAAQNSEGRRSRSPIQRRARGLCAALPWVGNQRAMREPRGLKGRDVGTPPWKEKKNSLERNGPHLDRGRNLKCVFRRLERSLEGAQTPWQRWTDKCSGPPAGAPRGGTALGSLLRTGPGGGYRPPDRRRGLQKAENGGPLARGPREYIRPRPPSPPGGLRRRGRGLCAYLLFKPSGAGHKNPSQVYRKGRRAKWVRAAQ